MSDEAQVPGPAHGPTVINGEGSPIPPHVQMWDVAYVAKVLEVEVRQATRLCLRGEVPGARRIGRRWYIHAATFLKAFTSTAARPAAADRKKLIAFLHRRSDERLGRGRRTG